MIEIVIGLGCLILLCLFFTFIEYVFGALAFLAILFATWKFVSFSGEFVYKKLNPEYKTEKQVISEQLKSSGGGI